MSHTHAAFLQNDSTLRRLGLTRATLDAWLAQTGGRGGLARVVSTRRGRWLVAGHLSGAWTHTPDDPGERGLGAPLALAAASGRLLAAGPQPTTGDWVALREQDPSAGGIELIDAVLPRASLLARKAAGGSGEAQVLAANLDVVLCAMAVGQNFNPSRLERYLGMAWDSGARPVVVLTKADAVPDPLPWLDRLGGVVQGLPCVPCSSLTGEGLDALRACLEPGRTAVVVGSSGAGKSTLLNALAGRELAATGALSEAVGKGRHTTVGRELFLLPSGALIIDTPGMRELELACDDGALASAFADLGSLGGACRFADCTHTAEPGCAVLAAVAEGRLDERRLQNWHKLQRELRWSEEKARRQERRGRASARRAPGDWRKELENG